MNLCKTCKYMQDGICEGLSPYGCSAYQQPLTASQKVSGVVLLLSVIGMAVLLVIRIAIEATQ